MKATLTQHVEEWLNANVPGNKVVAVLHEVSREVSPGEVVIKIVQHDSRPPPQYPAGFHVINAEPWNAGERTHATLAELYAAEFVEPYITWAGDLSWRATAEGKKAGLK